MIPVAAACRWTCRAWTPDRAAPGRADRHRAGGRHPRQLTRAAAEHGLQFPVDPGADATLGGMAATNASGTTTIRYGKMRAQVLALEAVLPGGRVIRTGSLAPKTSAGYDLTGLLVGSEGTLAVITELTVRLHPIPEATALVRASFASIEGAGRAVNAIVGAGDRAVAPGDHGRLDGPRRQPLRGVRARRGAHAVRRAVRLAGHRRGSTSTTSAGSSPSTAPSTSSRRTRPPGSAACGAPGTTRSSPRRRWPPARSTGRPTSASPSPSSRARSARLAMDRPPGARGRIVGHAGDGNLHVAILTDPGDADEMRRAAELTDALVDDALARGGTCTGEHGIGLGKIGALAKEHGDLLGLMGGVKAVFDPKGLMNPGKVLAGRAPGVRRRPGCPEDLERPLAVGVELGDEAVGVARRAARRGCGRARRATRARSSGEL